MDLKTTTEAFNSYSCRITVPCPATPENTRRCLVFLLDFYLHKLPQYAFEKDILQLQPKRTVPSDQDEPWNGCSPIGKHTLSNMVKDMSEAAGIPGK